jgi:hypothetical protein
MYSPASFGRFGTTIKELQSALPKIFYAKLLNPVF